MLVAPLATVATQYAGVHASKIFGVGGHGWLLVGFAGVDGSRGGFIQSWGGFFQSILARTLQRAGALLWGPEHASRGA